MTSYQRGQYNSKGHSDYRGKVLNLETCFWREIETLEGSDGIGPSILFELKSNLLHLSNLLDKSGRLPWMQLFDRFKNLSSEDKPQNQLGMASLIPNPEISMYSKCF